MGNLETLLRNAAEQGELSDVSIRFNIKTKLFDARYAQTTPHVTNRVSNSDPVVALCEAMTLKIASSVMKRRKALSKLAKDDFG